MEADKNLLNLEIRFFFFFLHQCCELKQKNFNKQRRKSRKVKMHHRVFKRLKCCVCNGLHYIVFEIPSPDFSRFVMVIFRVFVPMNSSSVRQSALFAADETFSDLLGLVACQRRGQRGAAGAVEVELEAHGGRRVFHVEFGHRDASACYLRSEHGGWIDDG